jgi:ABC-2 type transport system ATP-binding protein
VIATVDFSIETAALGRRFGRKEALRDLTLRVPCGGVHALLGRNGAGKTTLLRILLGFDHPTRGSSRVLGLDSQALSPEARGRIAYVNEEHGLPPWMTVAGLRDLSQSTYPRWSEKTYREVADLFRLSPAQRVSQLSHGEQAGLALALALAQSPDLLLLDEPTLGLDAVARQAFVEALLFLGDRDSTTVIYSSHQMDEIERVADDLIILVDGGLASFATPDEFQARVSAWIVDEMPKGRVVPGLLQSRDLEGQTQLVVLDQGNAFAGRLETLGARGITRAPLGFDRAVNAFLAAGGKGASA